MATSDELRRVALDQFSSAGYLATSLQNIADAAGVSKASVLYHFESKESLLDAALAPTVDALDVIVASLEGIDTSTAARRAFLAEFVDFLLEHRLGVHIFVNQSEALEDIAIIDRANSSSDASPGTSSARAARWRRRCASASLSPGPPICSRPRGASTRRPCSSRMSCAPS